MAESSDAQAQLLVILNGAILNYMYVSVLALYSFDVFLMVPSEVRLMWQGKPRITTLLYFTARYFLVPRVIIQLGQVPVPAKTCNIALYTTAGLSICTRASISVVLTGQVWAIYKRDPRVLAALGILAVAVCVFDALQISATTCVSEGSDYFKWVTVSITLQAVFAACVTVLTLYKVQRMVNWRDSIRSFGTETQFKYTRLVISESLRRITVCVLMILQTLFIRFSPENTNFFTAPFILPIEAILVSRFLLDLHAATAKHIDLTTSYDTSFSEITRDRRRGQSAGVHVDLLESDVTLIVQSLPFTP